MAIDTTAKKLSVLNLGNPWPGPLFDPDATIDLGDKQHALNLYSGIEAASAVSIVGAQFIEGSVFRPGLQTGMMFVPGIQGGDVFRPGLHQGEAFIPGGQEGEGFVPGGQEGDVV